MGSCPEMTSASSSRRVQESGFQERKSDLAQVRVTAQPVEPLTQALGFEVLARGLVLVEFQKLVRVQEWVRLPAHLQHFRSAFPSYFFVITTGRPIAIS